MSTINEDVQTLEPGPILEFWELNASAFGGGIVRFQGRNDGVVWWQGADYHAWPITAEGFQRTSDQQPTPKLLVGNVDGSITRLCLSYEDLVGATITRRRTFAKYLDARNNDGPELVSNGTFDADLTGWTVTAGTVTWFEGTMQMGNAASPSIAYIPVQTEAGKDYWLRYEAADNVVSTQVGTTVGGTDVLPILIGTVGNNEREFVGTGGTVYVRVVRPTSALLARVDDVSVREVGINADADPAQEFPPEVWFIERKSGESAEAVEFELSSALDFNGVKLPRRQIIANQCPFTYRGPLCNYTGPPVADITDQPTSDPLEDNCGRRLGSCKLREWPDGVLNFGGFPAAGLVRT